MQAIQLIAAVTLAIAAAGANAATVNSPPSLIQCQPAAITWTGAQPPVFLSVIPGKQPGAAPLEQFPVQNSASGSYTWNVNQAAGTSVTFQINDGTGTPNYSSAVTIQAGQSTNCGSGSGGSSSASSAGGSSASASSGAASASSGAASGTASRTSATTSGTATARPSTNAAVPQSRAGVALSGAAALVGAAFALA